MNLEQTIAAAGVSPKALAKLVANLGSVASIGNATVAELQAAGVPPKTAERLASAFAVGRAYAVRYCDQRQNVSVPSDVFDMLRHRIGQEEREHFVAIPIDVRNGVLDVCTVAIGTVAGVEVHPREVFRPALRCAAAGIVLAHNHPSGDPTPSVEDVELTRRMRQAGDVLGIPVIDHVVIAANSFRSIAEWMGGGW